MRVGWSSLFGLSVMPQGLEKPPWNQGSFFTRATFCNNPSEYLPGYHLMMQHYTEVNFLNWNPQNVSHIPRELSYRSSETRSNSPHTFSSFSPNEGPEHIDKRPPQTTRLLLIKTYYVMAFCVPPRVSYPKSAPSSTGPLVNLSRSISLMGPLWSSDENLSLAGNDLWEVELSQAFAAHDQNMEQIAHNPNQDVQQKSAFGKVIQELMSSLGAGCPLLTKLHEADLICHCTHKWFTFQLILTVFDVPELWILSKQALETLD